MILKGDCIEVMKAMKPNSVDAIVCDPPYGLEFMNKSWDKLDSVIKPQSQWWEGEFKGTGFKKLPQPTGSQNFKCKKCGHYKNSGTPCKCNNPDWESSTIKKQHEIQEWHQGWLTEAYRVLKPGGSMLVMGGTRTSHRLACAIEDTGFIIKDMLMWLYGSGFPKAQDLGKMIDKRNGRKVEDFKRLGEYLKKRRLLLTTRKKLGQDLLPNYKNLATTMAHISNWELGKQVPTKNTYDILKKSLLLDNHFDWLIEREEAERAKIGKDKHWGKAGNSIGIGGQKWDLSLAETDLAKHWDGFKVGTIKPSYEPIIWAVRPPEGSYVDNILKHEVGFINVDATRVGVPQKQESPVLLTYHSVYGDKCLSFLDSLSCNYAMPLSVVQDVLLGIASVLKPYNNDDKDLSHNEDGRDGNQELSFLYDNLSSRLFPNGAWCGLTLCEALNFRGDCPTCSHFYDEQIHKVEVSAQESAPLLADVLVDMSEGLSKLLHSHDCQSNHLSSEGVLYRISAFIHLLLTQDTTILHYINSPVKPKGRFPANVILSHHPECVEVGMKRVKNQGGVPDRDTLKNSKPAFTSKKHTSIIHHFDKDGLETVESWDCHTDCPIFILDQQSGNVRSSSNKNISKQININTAINFMGKAIAKDGINTYSDNGGASRFFYCAKASRGERNAGLDGMEEKGKWRDEQGNNLCGGPSRLNGSGKLAKPTRHTNNHPTVKPIKLFEYLIKLVTREGQIVLDPFIGSGTTAIAAHNTGRKCIGIEKEDEYIKIAKRRITHWENQPKQMEMRI